MTLALNSFSQADLPASNTTLYTTPGATTTAVVSAIISNKTTSEALVTVQIVRSGGSPVLSLLTNARVPVGDAIDVVINKPIILETGDILRAVAGTASALDVSGSVVEKT